MAVDWDVVQSAAPGAVHPQLHPEPRFSAVERSYHDGCALGRIDRYEPLDADRAGMGRHAPIGRHGEDVAQPVAAATAAYSVVFTNSEQCRGHSSYQRIHAKHQQSGSAAAVPDAMKSQPTQQG